ncbi:MAG TPA: hypothetical protein VFP46_02430, partial [Candidatus Paceibacterota bacterium]|nr:hypothetical protein [Candidatus Paceibacterota bacterium]
DGLSVLAREKLYQDLAVIKRDVLEIREQLIRSIDENFAIIDRAEQSKHLATAESLASVAMDQFIASLADARNKVQALYVRLKEVVDTAFDSKEKFLRGPH